MRVSCRIEDEWPDGDSKVFAALFESSPSLLSFSAFSTLSTILRSSGMPFGRGNPPRKICARAIKVKIQLSTSRMRTFLLNVDDVLPPTSSFKYSVENLNSSFMEKYVLQALRN